MAAFVTLAAQQALNAVKMNLAEQPKRKLLK